MQVLEPRGSRFDLALERLRAGHAFSFRGAGFWLTPDGYLEVSLNSSWRIEDTTKQTALNDLKRAKDILTDLALESPSFAEIVKAYPQRFILINDYGTGSVELCHLEDGELRWAKGMPYSTDAA